MYNFCSNFAVTLYNSPPLSHDSVLKALHSDKGILTSEECSECASKKRDWYKLAAFFIATKTTGDVRRALDVVQQHFPTEGYYYAEEFAGLLRGKPTLQLSLRNKEYT